MELVTSELREQLLANGRNPDSDRVPICRFFNPAGAGTWLVVDADPEDPDICFGLMDLGFGTPELGTVRVSELQDYARSVRPRYRAGYLVRGPLADLDLCRGGPAGRPHRGGRTGTRRGRPQSLWPRRRLTAFRIRSSAPSRTFRERGSLVSEPTGDCHARHRDRLPRPPIRRRRCTRWTRAGAKASRPCSPRSSPGCSTSNP